MKTPYPSYSCTLPCEGCGTVYTYYRTGNRARQFCDACQRANRRKATAEAVQRRKAYATEVGQDSASYCRYLATLTVRTHEEVARIMGITKEATRQLERRALAKLRKAFAFEMLQKQLDNSLRH